MVKIFNSDTWRVFQYVTLTFGILGVTGMIVNFNLMSVTKGRVSISSPTIAAWTALFFANYSFMTFSTILWYLYPT
jgi:hypothetical protein